MNRTKPNQTHVSRRVVAVVVVLLLLGIGAGTVPTVQSPVAEAAAGPRIYVASGDDIPAGHDLNDNAKRYPEKLLADHLKSPGWAVYNQAKNGTTSSGYISGGLLASAYNMRPDLLTLQLGEQNSTIVNLIKSCFDKVKDHDFTGANVCAATILGNASLWTNLQNNYTTILQQTRIMMSQRPGPGRCGGQLSEPIPVGHLGDDQHAAALRPADRHGDHLHDALGPVPAGVAHHRPSRSRR